MEQSNKLEMVTLRNGASESKVLVNMVISSLKGLLDNGQNIRLYELVMLCRDPNHNIFGNSGEKLAELSLIKITPGQPPKVHDSIRSIVLSAVCGEDAEMTIRSPLMPK